MQIIYTDVLVIGGGLAGQRAAIGAKRRGHEVIVLSLVPAKRSHSAAAQGGMQASLGNCLGGEGDNEDIHFADTLSPVRLNTTLACANSVRSGSGPPEVV